MFDPTFHEHMRSRYDDATNEYGRKVPHDFTVKSGTSGLDILGDWINLLATLVIILSIHY